MKSNNWKIIISFALFSSLFFSCEDLTETNIDTNGIEPGVVNPNLVLATVLTEAAKSYVNLGYQDIAGVVQHTQKDAWSSGHNDYDWGGSQDWSGYYGILRNNDLLYQRAVDLGLEFHQGVALVMKSFMFGLITDLWGDAPYTNALKAELGGVENTNPSFDSQEVIYAGIIADLETANTLLSKSKGEYSSIVDDIDVYYGGDPTQWRKFANSLMLRYYMRISVKEPAIAKAGIEKMRRSTRSFHPEVKMLLWDSQAQATELPGLLMRCSMPVEATTDASRWRQRSSKICSRRMTRD
jgi:hypothetical protein